MKAQNTDSKSHHNAKLHKRLSKELAPFTFDDLPLNLSSDLYFSNVYIFQKVIGAGSFGVVVAAIDKSHLERCAIKIISKDLTKNNVLSEVSYESEMLSELDHPSIVKFHRTHESAYHYFIVMELLKAGSLWDLICLRIKTNNMLTENESKVIIKQILEGIAYLHSKSIVHRDLKPENILLKSFNHLENAVCIADFGLCTKIDSEPYYNPAERCGTVTYMAPEVIQGKQYSYVFSYLND